MINLLKKSANPRFISVSSIGGCIGIGLVPTQAGGICYGASKAALNWATRKIHFENDWLGEPTSLFLKCKIQLPLLTSSKCFPLNFTVAFPLSPGGVSTDMGKSEYIELILSENDGT